jgi:Na+/H+ antiporter NhaD/arsenite permease-like protein
VIPLLDSLGPAAAAGLFVLTYTGIVLFKRHKTKVLWGGIAVALLFSRTLAPLPALPGSVNWNVMGIFAGTLLVAELFILSRVPELLAHRFVNRSGSVGLALFAIAVMTSLLSTFVENVATVLIVAPIALVISDRLKVDPTPFMIGIAISSNLQGTATLIGDPPSMILAAKFPGHMTFNDFFWMDGRPSIFFAVQIGAAASYGVLWLFYRRYRQKPEQLEDVPVRSWMPAWLLAGMVVALALSSLVDPGFGYAAGVISMAAGLLGLALHARRNHGEARDILRRYDWDTTFFLMGVFVMVGILERSGALDVLAGWLARGVGSSPLVAFVGIVGVSVVLSAVIDNVPYITAMIPVTIALSERMGLAPHLLIFGLLMGACLGGNVTPVGASANITAMGILKRHGRIPGFWDFMKIGLPFTLAATLAGAAFVWFVWA